MWVYNFREGSSRMRPLLGGKGADLAEMSQLGLPVPPGITVTTEACKAYFEAGRKFPSGLKEEILEKFKVIEAEMGRCFGDPSNLLLVSVRSGAPVSMPGMMDTVLNLGLNDQTVEGLVKQADGDERFAYDCYRRFIQLFSKVVLNVEHEKFEMILQAHKDRLGVKLDMDLKAYDLKEIVKDYEQLVKAETGREFPQDPYTQLLMAVEAVFNSWYTPRAVVYRKLNHIPDDLFTAVNIQVMVFGNRGWDSGTGVVFTRDPSTGEKKLYGEYLMNAQGEDVVAGIRTPKPIETLKEDSAVLYQQLLEICTKLEEHFKDVQDIEFTIEKSKLWMLQTRAGKRTAQAAVKFAVDLVKEKLIDIERALMMVQPAQLEQLLHVHIDPNVKVNPIAKGLPASPGAAVGKVVFDVAEATERGNSGESIILVRNETAPEDVPGLVASKGVLTSRGGMTCHAAVVARGMGKPAVVGCEEIKIDLDKGYFTAGDVIVKKEDVITIDGATGSIILGQVPMVEAELSSELKELLLWADEVRTLKVRTNADTPEAAVRAREFGAEGIGLCRTERMFNAKDRLPIVQEMILAAGEDERRRALEKLQPLQKDDFKKIFKAIQGFPVTIRLLDLPLHEFLPKLEELLVEVTTLRVKGEQNRLLEEKEHILKKVQELTEHNPMLGHRGCRLSIRYPEIYEMQTKAIFEAAGDLKREGVEFQLEIMLPLVGIAEELAVLRKKIEDIAEKTMADNGVKVDCLIGTMVEVPRAALTADKVAKYAQFFSFGTNDLTQTTFGYSRDDAEAKFLHDYLEKKILEFNPFEVLDTAGVGKLMRLAVELGVKTRRDLKVGICGEHGGEPSSIEFCHQLGLDYVSCSPFRVPVARLAAAQAKLKEKVEQEKYVDR